MEISKVKDWLKFRQPDYDGFLAHVKAWDKDGIPYGFNDLIRIALAYNIESPTIINNKLTFKK